MPVTNEEIAALAYQFWKERGEPVGSPELDWERAEATLQLRAVSLVKTALSESEPAPITGGAGDELLAEKTAGAATQPAAEDSPPGARLRTASGASASAKSRRKSKQPPESPRPGTV